MSVRAVTYKEALDGARIIYLIISMIYMSICLLICHLIITKVGMIFVNAEILSTGNEQLLNNLEEGLMILDEGTQEVIFIN